jgi:hypothetical protein
MDDKTVGNIVNVIFIFYMDNCYVSIPHNFGYGFLWRFFSHSLVKLRFVCYVPLFIIHFLQERINGMFSFPHKAAAWVFHLHTVALDIFNNFFLYL